MYRNLAQYLNERITAIGETPASLAERFGWGVSYIHNIINGQFRPSSKRCVKLAEAFGDDPNIILTLANYQVPNTADNTQHLSLLNSLTQESRDAAIDYLEYLKWKEDRS